MTNRRYGKKKTDNSIEYAPRTFRENGTVIAPRIDDDDAYHSRGWFTVVDIKPSYDATTKMLSFVGWVTDVAQMTLTAQYEIVDRPAPSTQQVRRFSKLKLLEYCIEQGIWKDLKEFLEGIGYYDLVVMAQMFLENDKFFMAGIATYKNMKVEEGNDPDDVQTAIDDALAFAFDGYETVEVQKDDTEPTTV